MSRKQKQKERFNDEAWENFFRAEMILDGHPIFSPLMARVEIVRQESNRCPRDGWALVTRDGHIHVHPTRRGEPAEWVYVLAHCLLHLGFGQFREGVREREWNNACCLFAARFLADLKLGRAPEDLAVTLDFAAQTEERLYEGLLRSGKGAGDALGMAGPRVMDMVWGPERMNHDGTPFDWQECFGQGLVEAVAEAVAAAGGEQAGRPRYKGPGERARAWFVDNYPLLGALAASFEIVENTSICQRMEISVAAVAPESREIFINPAAGLDEEEMRFVMAHELLHVGLRHDTRRQGRDHYLWNVACFPTGTWTGYGRPIEDVATMRRNYAGNLIEIDSQGGVVSCTPEHPFYARRRKGKNYPIDLTDAQWIEARDLAIGDYLLVPGIKNKCHDTMIDLRPYIREGTDGKGRATFGNRAVKEIPLNEDTAWLLGLYVAEGSASPGVRLSLGAHETALAERAVAVMHSLGYRATIVESRQSVINVDSGAVVFGRWLKKHCGSGAHSKCIPRVIILHEDAAIRRAFLQGLIQGDGHIRRQSTADTFVAMIGTVSERLVVDVALLLAQDGIGGHRGSMRRGPRRIGDTWTDKPLILHTFRWNPNGVRETLRTMMGRTIRSTSHSWRADEDGVWYPIRSLRHTSFNGEVYNLATEDHTYIAGGFLVHNCDYVINGWLIEMQVGAIPHMGPLYDESLKGMSAEAIYDMIVTDARRFRRLATLRGVGLSDILEPRGPGWWETSQGCDLDEFYRRALAQGLSYHHNAGRGYLPEGMIEEIRALSVPPIPWDVELAQWFDDHFPPIEMRRTYARASRRQSATPDIPRPNWAPPIDELNARTFGVVLDTSGSMDRVLLAKALGAIASYSVARDVPAARVVFCDAAAYDQGYMPPEDIAGRVKVRGRGGTVLQPGVELLEKAEDFPKDGPLLIITDGVCDRFHVHREHAFLMPEGRSLPFVPRGRVFRIK